MMKEKIIEGVRSNLEVFVIAFILAMTIRCFCIEVFKIPTSSMQPTLMGSWSRGDKIIASKFIKFFQPVNRFDVILFKYPLDRTKNFIKRVVGIPNEEILTRNGNIFYKPTGETTFHLARKPLKVQESIWLQIATGPGSPHWVQRDWEIPSDSELKDARVWLRAEDEELSLGYDKSIKDFYDHRGGDYEVTDVKVAFKLRFTQSGSKLVTRINTPVDKFILHLATHSKQTQVKNYLEHISPETGRTKRILEVTLLPEKDYFLEFMHYDGGVYIKLDKKLICSYDYQEILPEKDSVLEEDPIVITAIQGEVALWNIRIYRDIYYWGVENPVDIPPGKYFVIGDNVCNSRDSRAWRIKRVYLSNGDVIRCAAKYFEDKWDYIEIRREPNDPRKGGDIWGNEHTISKEHIKDIKEEPYHFVDDSAIFGKALLVYWPPGRIKLIR